MSLVGNPREAEIPADLKAEAEERRHTMVERIAELDDDLTVKYLEGEEISIRRAEERLAQGSPCQQGHSDLLWEFAAQQGCSAGAGCSHRLPALTAGCSAGHRHRSAHR